MMAKSLTGLGLLLLVFTFIGCLGRAPSGKAPKYENEPFLFNADYDTVWNATLSAARGLGWDIQNADETTGRIDFVPSFVINPEFDQYVRVYQEPTNQEAKVSDVLPYLRRMTYFDKLTPPPAPPHPYFTRETLSIDVTEFTANSTKVFAKYQIDPFFDYKIGYLGSVPSKGVLENQLFDRIAEIIAGKRHPAPVPPPPPPHVEYNLNDIFFDFDKSAIRADAIPVLEENAEIIKSNPQIMVLIKGYADVRGSRSYNKGLAKRRAEATKAFLVGQGISPGRLLTMSRGETMIFAEGKTEEAFQLNRRSHFIPVLEGEIPGIMLELEGP